MILILITVVIQAFFLLLFICDLIVTFHEQALYGAPNQKDLQKNGVQKRVRVVDR